MTGCQCFKPEERCVVCSPGLMRERIQELEARNAELEKECLQRHDDFIQQYDDNLTLREQRDAAEARAKVLETSLDRAHIKLMLSVRSSGIGGNLITAFTCFRCEQERASPNTACPLFCDECRQALQSVAREEGDK